MILDICRHELCERLDVHPAHLVIRVPPPPPKRRSQKNVALREAVKRATGIAPCSAPLPTYFSAVVRDVRDDYGPISERVIYFEIARLVSDQELLKLEGLGLGYAVYLAPWSRWRTDLEGIADRMMQLFGTNGSRGARTQRRIARTKGANKKLCSERPDRPPLPSRAIARMIGESAGSEPILEL